MDGDQGHPWCLRRSIDLILYLLFVAAREALIEPRGVGRRAGVMRSAPIDALEGVGDQLYAGEAQAGKESVAE